MKPEAVLFVAVMVMGFSTGLTFRETSPGVLALAGSAATGWVIAAWAILRRQKLDLAADSIPTLLQTQGTILTVLEGLVKISFEEKQEREQRASRRSGADLHALPGGVARH